MGKNIISGDKPTPKGWNTGIKDPKAGDGQPWKPAGSGSRAVPSKYKIASSAPKAPATMGRKPKGAL